MFFCYFIKEEKSVFTFKRGKTDSFFYRIIILIVSLTYGLPNPIEA